MASVVKFIAYVVVLGQVLVAPWATEFFPFSTFPMFSESPRSVIWEVSDTNRNLYRPYLANPDPFLARRYPLGSLTEYRNKMAEDPRFRRLADPRGEFTAVEVGDVDGNQVGVIRVIRIN